MSATLISAVCSELGYISQSTAARYGLGSSHTLADDVIVFRAISTSTALEEVTGVPNTKTGLATLVTGKTTLH